MNEFKNLKIAITDNDHLKAVCDVLESIGYRQCDAAFYPNVVISYKTGVFVSAKNSMNTFEETTLSDLLKMRDEMVKDNAKSSEE